METGSKWDIVNDPHTSPETLTQLSSDPDWMIRSAVAKNPHTAKETLKKLAKDEEWSVRNNVAINPRTPADTLDALSDDPDALVRSNLARNMSTSDETVMKLSITVIITGRTALMDFSFLCSRIISLILQFLKVYQPGIGDQSQPIQS